MGIYLPNMEMPTSCSVCKLFSEYGCPFIGAVGYALTRGERSNDCPLVEVPQHGRLVDGDRLLSERMKRAYYHLPNGDTAIPIIDIEHAPTIIPAEEGE